VVRSDFEIFKEAFEPIGGGVSTSDQIKFSD
jgi:hypothetical protein